MDEIGAPEVLVPVPGAAVQKFSLERQNVGAEADVVRPQTRKCSELSVDTPFVWWFRL